MVYVVVVFERGVECSIEVFVNFHVDQNIPVHVYVTELLIIRNKKVHVYDLVHVLHDFSQM